MRSRPVLRQVTCVECNSTVQVRCYDKCPHCNGWLADLGCTYLEGPFKGQSSPGSDHKTKAEITREQHNLRLKKLGIPVDLNGRSGFTINDPRLDEMERVAPMSREELLALSDYYLRLANGQREKA